MPKITDDEFGEITVRRLANASGLKISVAPNGSLRISSSKYMPLVAIKHYINISRSKIRTLLTATHSDGFYSDGDAIGKEHYIIVNLGTRTIVKTQGNVLSVTIAEDTEIQNTAVQTLIKQEVVKILRLEAKKYLPKRLDLLAQTMDAGYERLRFSHASTRWGSCSSSGTISLNIALMKLPYELIDYVIIHELAHTKHLNHSKQFWHEVSRFDAHFIKHRNDIKNHRPSI